MAVPDIVQAGDPVLRTAANPVDPARIGSREMQDLVATMTQAMRAAPGVGLAAPQIGVALQVIVLEDAERLMARLSVEERDIRERAPFPLRTIFNPVLELGDAVDQPTFFEGCLSVAGYMALVPRHREVIVTGLDERGAPLRWHAVGWPARILQHEIDHLRGTLYIDRMMTRSFACNAEVQARWMSKPIEDVIRELDVERDRSTYLP
jgi:peptide deformylase